MKVVKYLIVLALTCLWVLIMLVLSSSLTNPLTTLSVVTLLYFLLIYLVWPVGTGYSEVLFSRFYKVIGALTLLMAGHVMLNNECLTFPNVLAGSAGYATILLAVCAYIGKLPASLILAAFGGWLIYLGYTKTPEPSLNRVPLKRA